MARGMLHRRPRLILPPRILHQLFASWVVYAKAAGEDSAVAGPSASACAATGFGPRDLRLDWQGLPGH